MLYVECWTVMPKHALADGDEVPQEDAKTLEQCREECIKQAPCGGLEFDPEAEARTSTRHECYLHLHLVDKAKIEDISSHDISSHDLTVAFHLLERDCLG